VKSGYTVKLDSDGDITVAEYIGEDLQPERKCYLQFICNNCGREIDIAECEEIDIEKAIEEGELLSFYIVCKQCKTHYKLLSQLIIEEERHPGNLVTYKI
jgi:hypothetical protein